MNEITVTLIPKTGHYQASVLLGNGIFSVYDTTEQLAREKLIRTVERIKSHVPMCDYCHTRHYGYEDHQGA